MAWLKEILDENRRTVASWPEWKRGVGMMVQLSENDDDEVRQLKLINAQLKADNTHYKKALDIVHLIVEHDDADFSCCSQDIKAEAEEYGLDTLLKLKEKNADLLDNLSRCKGNELAVEVAQLKADVEQAKAREARLLASLEGIAKIRFLLGNDPRLNPAYEMGDIAQRAVEEAGT